jgi:hypothetical protein
MSQTPNESPYRWRAADVEGIRVALSIPVSRLHASVQDKRLLRSRQSTYQQDHSEQALRAADIV